MYCVSYDVEFGEESALLCSNWDSVKSEIADLVANQDISPNSIRVWKAEEIKTSIRVTVEACS